MPNLRLAGDSDSILNGNTQANVKAQLAALVDLMRQVAGDAAVSAGNLEQADPLNAPFTIYVNPYTGSDKFVGGQYNSFEAGATDEQIIASKLKRLEKQRLTCGFTPQRPFKTINRAIIEAAIITSKNWYTYTDPRAHVDCVSIVLAPGVHTLYNDPGSTGTSLASWGTEKDPSIAELIAFNPANIGGVLLPRGCSLCGPDLRKTTIRPSWVPGAADEASDYSNRRGMLKITGTGYFFGFTVMDKVGLTTSHHLLDAFHFGSKTELDAFYAKCFSAVGTGADLGAALTVSRPTEYEIVGPIDTTQSPTAAWDTTASASPYIFNCSIRSDYGLGGAWMDGAKVGGLKSMVCANFTGVSLQKDMSSWQRYDGSGWTTTTYQQYISTTPNNIRMNPARMSRHISAVNDAFIQEVSVFAIGQGIHHFTDRGGEITVTNSNSSFGGCAALSRGYKGYSFAQDSNWTIGKIKVPLNLSEKVGNVRRIFLGVIESVTNTQITLVSPLAADDSSETIPALLLRDGYSLLGNTKIWVENPLGDHWRADLTSTAWQKTSANQINIQAALTQAGSNAAVGINTETGLSLAVGKRVYIRRVVDSRSPNERRLSLLLNNTTSARLPERNFVLQTDPSRTGGAISRELATGGSEVLVTSNIGIGPVPGPGVAKTAEVTLRRGAPTITYANSTYYRAGTVVRHQNKHFQALRDQITATPAPDPTSWGETFVHMPSTYNTEDAFRNEAPILVFDTDTDPNDNTETCGINFSTVWTSAGAVREQYRSGIDYLAAHAFLVALGFSTTAAHEALVPRAASSRERNPASTLDFPTPPSGGAATALGNWAVEFRRPSVLRLYGHAWEWAGFLNYSKSIPAAQQDMSPQNKFSYYFTNDAGGRVVPQGSNEDGYNITPRGLEDIETGTTITVEDIGGPTLDTPTTLNNLTLTGTTTINDSLIVNATNVAFPSTFFARTNAPGIGTIASTSDLNNPGLVTTDTQLNAAGPRFVTPEGLRYLADQRYAPILDVTAKRLFVLPTGSSLPTNATTYPVIEGGTVNLNNVVTYSSIQQAYASLPVQFSLPEGDHVDIYLLAPTVDMGSVKARTVGSEDPQKRTFIIPFNWDNNAIQQVIRYTLTDNFDIGEGPFYNTTFYTITPFQGVNPIKGRIKLEVTATALTGSQPRQTVVVGSNIQSSNLLIEIIMPASDTVRRTFVLFRGCNFMPYLTYVRHNERPIYLGLKLSGPGVQANTGGVNSVYGYDVIVFRASENRSVNYGAAMCASTTIDTLDTDEQRRLATALFEFENARSTTATILFHHLFQKATLNVDGAASGGQTTNMTWRLLGSAAWQWRLFGFNKSFDELSGFNAANVFGFFSSRGTTTQSWGGFLNENSSTNRYAQAHTAGPFTIIDSQSSNWGIFGAGGNVTAANSLLGADGSGYYLRPDPTRYNIINPAS